MYSGSIAFLFRTQVSYSSRTWASFAQSELLSTPKSFKFMKWSGILQRANHSFCNTGKKISNASCWYNFNHFRSFNCISYSWSRIFLFHLCARSNSYKVVEVNRLCLCDFWQLVRVQRQQKRVRVCWDFFALLFKWNCQKKQRLVNLYHAYG